MKCPMSVESGELGESAPPSAVVVCKLVNTASSMETNVALIVLMAMATKNNGLATLTHAQLIVKEVGASTVPVLQLVVVETRNVCTPSPERPRMVAKLAQRHAVLRKSMRAAQNRARRIAKATLRIGASAPMVVLVQMAWNVAWEVCGIANSSSTWPAHLADALAKRGTRRKNVTCLVAQSPAKVPGVNGVNVKARIWVRLRLMVAMAKPHAVVEAQRPRSSPSRSRKSVVVHAAQQLMTRL
jgi:hypothetical protein